MELVKTEKVHRGDVFLVNLKPTVGGEIQKTRPCLIVSPDELNSHLRTFIIAPLTTGGHSYPFRIKCRFHGKICYIVLDQIRTVDRERLLHKIGNVSSSILEQALGVLQEMFAL